MSWRYYEPRTLPFEPQIISLADAVIRRNAGYKKEDYLQYKIYKNLGFKSILSREQKWLQSKVVIIRTRVQYLANTIDYMGNLAIIYEPIKRGKKYLRILILNSINNLINYIIRYLIILYDTKKKWPVRLCGRFAYELYYKNLILLNYFKYLKLYYSIKNQLITLLTYFRDYLQPNLLALFEISTKSTIALNIK